jgi:DNA-binding transcriptional ArsR family regulator
MIEDGIYENLTEEQRAKVLKVIHKLYKGKPVTRSKISWYIKFLKARELTEVLHKLREEGVIIIEECGNNQFRITPIKKGGKSL